MSGEPPVLAFQGISAVAGSREVLRGVTLSLAAGEVLTLAGPNGAGKTTLFRVASRVLRPTAGSVSLLGRPLDAYSRRELARVLAVVPQDAVIAFPFRVGEVVLMGRSPHLGPLGFETPADLERAREAMARVGIEALADRSVLELSGGERQLVLLARALAQDPRVLLLDEPTAHLDLRHRVSVAALVRELAREGRSALVVSHDLGLAARSGDRIALLRAGELHAVGAPREVLTPAHLRATFEVEAEILTAADGTLHVVPKRATGC
ncbi:MAG TPA: ABC transporter ATP-binding protein [Myxococcota bacterium]